MTRWRIATALVAAVAGVAAAVALGNWQLRRAEQKLALQAQWDAVDRGTPEDVTAQSLAEITRRVPVRVRLRGRFLHDRTVWLDNRQHDGRPGFWVVTPLLLDGASAAVLVNRGWAPRNSHDRTALPPVGQPQDVVALDGVGWPQVPRLLDLGPGPAPGPLPAIWQNLDFVDYERASGLAVARFVVQQSSSLDDGLLRQWPRPDTGVNTHRGYAVQWFALAALIAALALGLGIRAVRRGGRAGAQRPDPGSAADAARSEKR